MDVGLSPVSGWYERASVKIHVQIFLWCVLPFLLDKYPGVEGWVRGQVYDYQLSKREDSVPFPQTRCRVSGSPNSQQQSLFSAFLILVDVKGYLIVALFSHD